MMTRRLSTPRSERAELAEHAEGWSGFVLANILWAILSLPVVTLPAATAGLFAYMSARARGQQPDVVSTFFGAFRRHWRKATLLACLDLLVGGLVVLNGLIFARMDFTADLLAVLARSVTLFVALALLLINLYAWSLLVLLETMSVRRLISSAAALVFSHPFWSMGVLAAAALPVAFSLLLPQGIFVIATASLCAWIVCAGTWRVIRVHLAPELLASLQAHSESSQNLP
ncbi:MAG: YesL family protein [Anaerolineae bacterium]|nr:YesL family protein [Anaerolineae bacterium]